MNVSVLTLSNPPSYHSRSSFSGSRTSIQTDLPAYAPRLRRSRTAPVDSPPRAQHEYTLAVRSSGIPWATLKLLSRAHASKQVPMYAEGDKIKGALVLDAKKAGSTRCVTLTLMGQILTSSTQWLFLEHKVVLWDRSSSSHKLQAVELPFSFSIPTEVDLNGSTYRLPQTSVDPVGKNDVQYSLFLHMKRSGLVTAVSSSIRTVVAYMPRSRPPPPSELRSLAYNESTSIPGPDVDPDGWRTLPPCTFYGKTGENAQLKVKCTLWLARPLSYTRGSVIPCMLSISSSNHDVLSRLNPALISLRLRQTLTVYPSNIQNSVYQQRPAMDTVVDVRKEAVSMGSARYHETQGRWKDTAQDVGTAVWWPVHREPDDDRMHFEGEVKLHPQLRPTSQMGNYRIRYSVVLMPIEHPKFTYKGDLREPLLEVGVDIVTMYAPGPRPRAYAPMSEDT
ncbi:hypothetical protein CYLTODRAFT_377683 [Cylindrobasidium torrendii FP15055 ss-10]|uniref:Arrestin-like N-terminal domain-containing protein n=1 Tax=Cylindrobasidium torrendii FP15055 ss-10 TaxID=1314674 RepID=A0A0D7BAD7_9AGAR|nr:hypothetical protein CYLTODRAFT_377683 [Cylindrobasidium torrendii FP15055 ss-10]